MASSKETGCCLNDTWETTEQYLKLEYHIGIGGSILQQEERAKELWEAVRHVPMDRILIETDAPFILPYCKDTLSPKLLRCTRNTSMILLEVIKKIAKLKELPAFVVEEVTTESVICVFRLPI